jgi:hypothetical protein
MPKVGPCRQDVFICTHSVDKSDEAKTPVHIRRPNAVAGGKKAYLEYLCDSRRHVLFSTQVSPSMANTGQTTNNLESQTAGFTESLSVISIGMVLTKARAPRNIGRGCISPLHALAFSARHPDQGHDGAVVAGMDSRSQA